MIFAMSASEAELDGARPATRDDAQLELALARGDRAALELLLSRHAPAVFTLCRALCGPSAAHDAAQESLTKVVSAIRTFDPARGSFRTFSLAVARNVCRDFGRRRKRERQSFEDPDDRRDYAADPRAKNPEREVMLREHMSDLDAALSDLPAPMREALIRFHLHDASYEEIASALEVPVGTVMSWLHRGRKRLHEALLRGDR